MLLQIESINKDIIRDEIIKIAESTGINSDNDLVEKAMQIAFDYIKENEYSNPITLARASFYALLKKYDPHPEKKVQLIIHNNGKQDKWWLYLVPIIEKHLEVK